MKNIFFLFFLFIFFICIFETRSNLKEIVKTKTLKINFFKKAYAVDETLPCDYQNLLDQIEELLAELEREKWKYKSQCSWRAIDMCFMATFFDKKIQEADKRIPPIEALLEEAKKLTQGDNPSVICNNTPSNQNPQNPPPNGGPTTTSNNPDDNVETTIPTGIIKENKKTGDITFFPQGPGKKGITFKNGNLDDPKLWKKMGLNNQQIKDLEKWTEDDLTKEGQSKESQILSQKTKNKEKLVDVPFKDVPAAGSTDQINNSSKNDKTKQSKLKSKKGFKSLFRKGFKKKNKKLAQSTQSKQVENTKRNQDENKDTHLSLFLRVHKKYEKLNTQNYFF